MNYDKEMLKIIDNLQGKPRLLLHSCCGPCSTSVISQLAEVFDLTVFFFNPNITDKKEYLLRKENQIKFLSEAGYLEEREGRSKIIFREGNYDSSIFYSFAENLKDCIEGGLRCSLCYKMRLEETAKIAKAENADFFATTLTVSPMKNAEIINEIGAELSKEYQATYLYSDFKKREGYKKSIELSKQYSIYRQHYCGCEYSEQIIKQ